ncbi:MAG: malate synthase A [Candidatus Marinimicrobia bacterium]|jgi:malate synthase|nr:malate synthase A [Candidatus Neomarinimicrobiota bacterium]MDP7565925.1 malate synthase A [Candidatus Neomarinimicrobiota bacterium]MDP7715405.1 malate synthase A [Candidatus Neomarinimicrobiota bacterium]HBN45587.1 malate synthase A [Candidatus Neomarinimicrobiota bacterium]HJL74737.1 malate synthase A [Candidatus Neomarinimicrobiota bacterium]|tara:strand:- start:12456 stop:14060 length:1605 start_codon:yes stop_codon:yes gene_type:complete
MNTYIQPAGTATRSSWPEGVSVPGSLTPGYEQILSFSALEFIAGLHSTFNVTRQDLLHKRKARQVEIDNGVLPHFLPETEHIRNGDWVVADIPHDLQDRRVEITGPVDRKMIINALNSPVKVFMADFEDSNSPTWDNTIQGQINLRDAVDGTISFIHPTKDKEYRLNEKTATLMVRPRGWHLNDKHIMVDDEEISGSLLDFGLFFFHNAKSLINKGSGPYFYLPKLESHLEARLWNDVFIYAQQQLDIPVGTIRATVLIETVLAAFEMDEILYELRNHSAGLNCGRWDYIFSFIKKFRQHSDRVFPDRTVVTMDRHFMKSYVNLLVKTCHQRQAHAMGGMAAQIPIKNDPPANVAALDKVRQDKEREAKAGHDGTWIAHPGLADIAVQAFSDVMPQANQLDVKRDEVEVTATDLLKVPTGVITEEGFRHNIRVGIQYIAAWLTGNGCVPLYHLMEDAATAEICRTQLWQWIRHGAEMENGQTITLELFTELLADELSKLEHSEKLEQSAELFKDMVLSEDLDEFLTLPAYKILN